jgi:hypothetical protein
MSFVSARIALSPLMIPVFTTVNLRVAGAKIASAQPVFPAAGSNANILTGVFLLGDFALAISDVSQ